jgi:hypothetical protein
MVATGRSPSRRSGAGRGSVGRDAARQVGMFSLGIVLIGQLSAAKLVGIAATSSGSVKPADAPVTRAACVDQDLDIRDRTYEKGQ